MSRARSLLRIGVFTVLTAVVLTACAPPSPAPSRSADGTVSQSPQASPGRKKVLNLGLRTILDGFCCR